LLPLENWIAKSNGDAVILIGVSETAVSAHAQYKYSQNSGTTFSSLHIAMQ